MRFVEMNSMVGPTDSHAPMPDGLSGRVRRMRLLAVLLSLTAIAAGYFFYRSVQWRAYTLRISAGDPLGHRHALAEVLAAEAAQRRLKLELHPTSGSEAALDEVAAGRLDVALVQGGLEPRPEIRQVAVLVPEPLHLIVRPKLLEGGVEGLRGARLNLSAPGSGTHKLALQTLALVGLNPGDYHPEETPYAELHALAADRFPDAVFVVSALPSHMVEWIVSRHGYRLMPLPFGPAMSLRDASLQDFVIPAYTYSVVPAVPAEPIHTVASWLTVVARRDVPEEAVTRLLESIFDGDFALHSELTGLSAEEVVRRREFPLHAGTTTYLSRNQPLITGDLIEGIENLRSFLVSGAIAAFLAWRWFRRRESIGFERYLDEATGIETEILERRRAGTLDSETSRDLEDRLSRLKSDALEQFSSGNLRGDEHLSCFLAHISDVRQCLRRQSA